MAPSKALKTTFINPELSGVDFTAKFPQLLGCDAIAIGFTKNEAGKSKTEPPSFTLVGPKTLIRKIESTFALNLLDELTFFSPSGKAGEIFELPASVKGGKVERILLVGLGDSSLNAHRISAGAIARKFRGKKVSIASLVVGDKSALETHATSLALGGFQWSQKSAPVDGAPKFLINSEKSLDRAAVISAAVNNARALIHTPANIKNPEWMALQVKKLAKSPSLKVTVKSGKELAEFGGLRAVGNSSPKPGPRFIQVSYAPAGSSQWPHVVLVGKGITFDTGGVSLKRPYDTMTAMKSDMAGAAAVLATVIAMPELKPKVRVTALLMMAENALSGTAQRPSDVITHYGGTTVEVINTDAEGRLVLADGLAFADLHLNPDYLLDVATLTGAASLGLGRQYAAMYTRSAKVAKDLSTSGERSGDRVWHMPLVDDYAIALKSSIADFNHTADKPKFGAGSVTAALFLEKFVGERNWIHLDIAGPARSESDTGEQPKGGTGFGVRLLIDWITHSL